MGRVKHERVKHGRVKHECVKHECVKHGKRVLNPIRMNVKSIVIEASTAWCPYPYIGVGNRIPTSKISDSGSLEIGVS